MLDSGKRARHMVLVCIGQKGISRATRVNGGLTGLVEAVWRAGWTVLATRDSLVQKANKAVVSLLGVMAQHTSGNGWTISSRDTEGTAILTGVRCQVNGEATHLWVREGINGRKAMSILVNSMMISVMASVFCYGRTGHDSRVGGTRVLKLGEAV